MEEKTEFAFAFNRKSTKYKFTKLSFYLNKCTLYGKRAD